MSTTRRIIVAGGGRIGTHTAKLLHDRGHTVVLIEQDPERSEALSAEHVATVINGDATRPPILEQADLDQSDAIAALTESPGTNLAICLLAREKNSDIHTIARTHGEKQKEYTEYIDSVVLTQQCVANHTVDLLVGGEVRTFSGKNGEFDVLDLVVTEGASIAGHTLDEVTLPDGCRVIAGVTTGELATPEMTFEPEHRYLLAVASGTMEDVRMLFQE